MMDPLLLKALGDARLEELRGEARRRAIAAHGVPGWRRIAGEALLRAALRLLGEPRRPARTAVAGQRCD